MFKKIIEIVLRAFRKRDVDSKNVSNEHKIESNDENSDVIVASGYTNAPDFHCIK